MSIKNARDGQSLVDTQEGAMQEISGILQRMRELAVQSASGSVFMNSSDRGYLQTEMTALVAEITAIAANTKFNDTNVLQGSTFSFYTDIDVAGTKISVLAVNMSITAVIGVETTMITIASRVIASMSNVVTRLDTGIDYVNSKRASLGAISNRFDHVIDNLTNVVANTESAKSRVLDADFAIETTRLTRNTILQQAATSMVAQANGTKNSILALIQ